MSPAFPGRRRLCRACESRRCTAAKYSSLGAQPRPRATVDTRSSLGRQRRSWAAPMFCIQTLAYSPTTRRISALSTAWQNLAEQYGCPVLCLGASRVSDPSGCPYEFRMLVRHMMYLSSEREDLDSLEGFGSELPLTVGVDDQDTCGGDASRARHRRVAQASQPGRNARGPD